MDRTATRSIGHIAGLALAGLVLISGALVAACTSAAPTPDPNQICDGIAADIGGCGPERPVYSSTTCAGLAQEWATLVDERLVSIIAGDASVDGKARSVRSRDLLYLTGAVLAYRVDELGIRDTCQMEEFWPIAEATFSEAARSGAGSVLYDGNPTATWDDWVADAKRSVGVIDGS
jgi:hypothetical protein